MAGLQVGSARFSAREGSGVFSTKQENIQLAPLPEDAFQRPQGLWGLFHASEYTCLVVNPGDKFQRL